MKFLTTAEVAEIIRESSVNVSRRCSAGQIAAKKLGGEWRISEDAVALFMSPSNTASPRRRLTARQRKHLTRREGAA